MSGIKTLVLGGLATVATMLPQKSAAQVGITSDSVVDVLKAELNQGSLDLNKEEYIMHSIRNEVSKLWKIDTAFSHICLSVPMLDGEVLKMKLEGPIIHVSSNKTVDCVDYSLLIDHNLLGEVSFSLSDFHVGTKKIIRESNVIDEDTVAKVDTVLYGQANAKKRGLSKEKLVDFDLDEFADLLGKTLLNFTGFSNEIISQKSGEGDIFIQRKNPIN